jgi:predicted metal-dependent HD superfamily phosphohydrolase
MNLPGLERWIRLWRNLGADGDPQPGFDRLMTCYSEPHRHYHNQIHLAECLREFDSAHHLAQQPKVVEAAIWFHDAIYDTRGSDNEERSAVLVKQCLSAARVPEELISAVVRLVLTTKHHDVGLDADARLMVDVDLSILGQPGTRFWEYEAQIREEYAWVPTQIFAEKRSEVLGQFLGRQFLYATDWFRQRYEAQARINLQQAVAKLKSSSPSSSSSSSS